MKEQCNGCDFAFMILNLRTTYSNHINILQGYTSTIYIMDMMDTFLKVAVVSFANYIMCLVSTAYCLFFEAHSHEVCLLMHYLR